MSSKIFWHGSRTFFFSSWFFPKRVWHDVCTLYAFVRTADDYVDSVPQMKNEFSNFCDEYNYALNGGSIGNEVISSFVELQRRKRFNDEWVVDFLSAMESDLYQTNYESLSDLLKYMQGSAETVGLMMARVMGLPDESLPYAQMLGRSLQFANFIRDIAEDNLLGRTYFPQEVLRRYHLRSLQENDVRQYASRFGLFMQEQVERFYDWHSEAKKGFVFMPKIYRVPVMTAAQMYEWTIAQVEKDPFVVFEKKVRPSVARIVLAGVWNAL